MSKLFGASGAPQGVNTVSTHHTDDSPLLPRNNWQTPTSPIDHFFLQKLTSTGRNLHNLSSSEFHYRRSQPQYHFLSIGFDGTLHALQTYIHCRPIFWHCRHISIVECRPISSHCRHIFIEDLFSHNVNIFSLQTYFLALQTYFLSTMSFSCFRAGVYIARKLMGDEDIVWDDYNLINYLVSNAQLTDGACICLFI